MSIIMIKLRTIFIIAVTLLLSAQLFSQYSGNFGNSLHKLRQGKEWFYRSSNGGFETLTNIPMSSLHCGKCHPGKLANGTPIDPATYQPSCFDCHVTAGDVVQDTICLRCHSRQKTERSFYTDKHRSAGMKCFNCHGSQELHGSGVQYNAMLDTTLGKTCQSSGCHTSINLTTQSHSIHASSLECASCHVRSEVSCYNCHFETEIAVNGAFKRPHTQMRNFIMLGKNQKTGKVGLMNFQSLTYNGKSFYGMAPYYSHTIMSADSSRTCSACHDNANIRQYNSLGYIYVAKWDSTLVPKRIVTTTGVIPVPPDWSTSLKFDYVTYTGRLDTTYTDPSKWIFLKNTNDGTQMISAYAAPLTTAQMNKLSMPIGINDPSGNIPDKFALNQNYPNPFNPGTQINFAVPKTSYVTMKIYDMLGNTIYTFFSGKKHSSGLYSYEWNTTSQNMKILASGLYFCNMTASDETGQILYNNTLKMILLK